jgi:hypothetical protein
MIILRQGNSKAERGGGVVNAARGCMVFCVAGCILFTHFVLFHPYFENNILRQGEKNCKTSKVMVKTTYLRKIRIFTNSR